MKNAGTVNYDLNYLKAGGYTREQLLNDSELCGRVMEALLPQIRGNMLYMSSLLQQLGLEPQDAAQEFLLKFLSSESLFNGALSTAQPLAYLRRSAKNMLLDMEKKRHIDTTPLEVDGKINIADENNFERDIINRADAAAALRELNNYDEFDAVCFLACRYFGIRPQQLAQSLQRHGFHALAKATVKSAAAATQKKRPALPRRGAFGRAHSSSSSSSSAPYFSFSASIRSTIS